MMLKRMFLCIYLSPLGTKPTDTASFFLFTQMTRRFSFARIAQLTSLRAAATETPTYCLT